MAAIVGRTSRQVLLKAQSISITPQNNASYNTFKDAFSKLSRGKKIAVGTASALTSVAIGTGVALQTAVMARDLELHPPTFPWNHDSYFESLDHASMRRGFKVYKEVCAACHTMNYMFYRNLVGTVMTEDEAKAEAADQLVTDGPDEEGNMFQRPGKLADRFVQPYANDEAAKAANNGALPPDLTYIVNARHGGENYIFSLLTGYCDAPAGITVGEGQAYNPYFLGGNIGMPQQLFNEGVEYDDGTEASVSQMAKDISTFLKWAAEPEHDERKRMGIKSMIVVFALTAVAIYMKKSKWTVIKFRKLAYKPVNKR